MKILIILFGLLFFLGQCQSQHLTAPLYGKIDENFKVGKKEYSKVFKNKIIYPEQLKEKKITGNVYFEIEIDTIGNISKFTILKGINSLMDGEVEKKIFLTNGRWIPLIKNEKKVNFTISDNVYFELF